MDRSAGGARNAVAGKHVGIAEDLIGVAGQDAPPVHGCSGHGLLGSERPGVWVEVGWQGGDRRDRAVDGDESAFGRRRLGAEHDVEDVQTELATRDVRPVRGDGPNHVEHTEAAADDHTLLFDLVPRLLEGEWADALR